MKRLWTSENCKQTFELQGMDRSQLTGKTRHFVCPTCEREVHKFVITKTK